MPKFFPAKYTNAEAVAALVAEGVEMPTHTKYTDAEAEAAALANADISDAITKKHTQGTDNLSRARAYRATSYQVIANTTITKVELNAEDYDNQGEFDPVTNFRFTANEAGYYVAAVMLGWVSSVDQSLHQLRLCRNGAMVAVQNLISSGIEGPTNVVSDIVYLSAGQYIELYVYQATGDDVSLRFGHHYTFMAIHKLS